MSDLDPAHVLFPSDAPTQPPEWFSAHHGAAEQRLVGNHGQRDGSAAAPFPNERKADASPSAGNDDDAASALFKDDAARKDVDWDRVVGGELDQHTLDAIKDGDTDRADALKSATAALTDDFRSAGTDPAEIEEAFSIVRQSAGFKPPTSEESEASFAAGMSEIAAAGVTDADLNAARRFIRDLETVSPGVVASLEAHNAGNNPKLILAAVREARRRKY